MATKRPADSPGTAAAGLRPADEATMIDEADGVRVGEEPVPGMRLRRICRAGQGTIGRLAWSPCGRFIVSPSDKTIRIWDASNGESLGVLAGHKARCVSAAWSPDSKIVVTGDMDGTVAYWSVKTGERIKQFRAEAVASCVWDVAWSPDGTRVAAGLGGRSLLIWQAHTDSEIVAFRLPKWVYSIAWSPRSDSIAAGCGDGSVWVYDLQTATSRTFDGHGKDADCVTWSPDAKLLASGSEDHTIRVWDAERGQTIIILEGHSGHVSSVSFSSDGRLLGSKSRDGTVRIWDCSNWDPMATILEPSPKVQFSGLAFAPGGPTLATLGSNDGIIRLWDIDTERFIRNRPGHKIVHYTSSKIVLVGESNVGKSCLAIRLAEGRYPDDYEHRTTHGMQFWPMEAEVLHPTARPPEGQRRDVVLWDFGGQSDYQLVHLMFLHDTTLALVLIDPTRGHKALDEARDWNKRLEKHTRRRRAVKFLLGAQVDDDRKSGLINRGAIQALCEECGFAGFFETSALTGREIDGLRVALAGALDWENLARTSRPELFQRIRDEIELMREAGDVVVLVADLQASIRENRTLAEPPRTPASRRIWESWKKKLTDADAATTVLAVPFDDAAFGAVTDQLATQGVIVKTRLTGGDEAIVLQLPVIERYAASLVLAARDNPRGVPALEAGELGSPSITLPGMTDKDRVPRGQERVVLEAVAELMIEHGLCFRHEGLLVFPTLLRATETARADELPGSVSLYYDFSGAIDNVYASLISWLVIGQGFGRIRLWENRVEFEAEGRGACGLRRVDRRGGFAHLDVYFLDGTPTRTQTEFMSFVHQHLRSSGIDVVEHFELICANADCRYEFPRVVVQNRMARGEADVVCPQCETRIKLSEAFRREREQDERAERTSFALMTRVRKDVPKIVASVKQRGFGRADDEFRTDRPIRILHLSDLHFTADTVPETKLQWLDDDIRKGKWLGGGELDYVVISGDLTHQGSVPGFRRASEFVSLLVDRFGLSAERFIVVPGNHDVQDLDDAYDWRLNVTDDEKTRAVKEGRLFGFPSDGYNQRLREFSDQFYHPLLQKPYPLDPAQQGVAYIFPETKLQFLTLNSCWEIDQFHRTRASVHPDAVARLIAGADRQIQRASVNTDVTPGDYLRIAVWHHPVADAERGIRNREFLGNLQGNRVKVCLTGDVHELRRELVDYWHDNRMHVLGAGSFGAKGQDLSEGSPRLYNLLEIDRGFRSIRIHTRQQPKPDGSWKGWNEWPMPRGGEGGLPHFDIHFEERQPRSRRRPSSGKS